jgi:hypothetical protein
MTTESKRICVVDTFGPQRSDHPFPIELPDELWARVSVWWPGNYELKWVIGVRRLCRAFAQALKYRVYAHTPNTQLFLQEARYLYTYNWRQRLHGQLAYGNAFNMVYARFYETNAHRRDRHQDMITYHRLLIRFMQNQGQLMPTQFDGFVARLNNSWARFFCPRHKYIDLEEQFKRIRSGGHNWRSIVAAEPDPESDADEG